MTLTLILLFIVGATIGSFLNVVVYRLPRGESIIAPGSHCPRCDMPVAWYDNIPLVSYMVLGARCRKCGEPISVRYPIVELSNAVLYVLAGWKFGPVAQLLPALLLISTLIVLALIDLDYYIIPNVIVVPAAIIGLASLIAIAPSRWLELLAAGLASGAFFFIIALLKPGGMGMGDAKMAVMLGFFLGKAVLPALFLAFLLGAFGGVALIAMGRRTRKGRVPFGPFLALGGLIALFVGNNLLDWYTGLFGQSSP